ncbi:hypothetical protein DICVIV_02988 [Dictyocaulus viviparus]|uniref:Uncharacterized protein n=1 Tax=Dictyocaulus viviparus TaxID=29172 RepID=A0A0D8Y1W7_DICVI|nr:hypothetical protein DICVIV_02988 [Dictyocaulus viviparus]
MPGFPKISQAGYRCVSLYDDMICKQLYGPDFHYLYNGCTNITKTRRFATVAQIYFHQFATGNLTQNTTFHINIFKVDVSYRKKNR